MKLAHLLATATLSLAAASPALATIVIDVGPGVLQPDENLLFNNNPAPGSTIQGVTNQTATLVSVSGGETLVGDGGQARVQAQTGAIDSTFTYHGRTGQTLGFDLFDPALAFTSTEFRIFGGTATQLALTFVDTEGNIFTSTLAAPANGFFNARAIDGQQIDYFSIAANGTIGDIRQIRIGGVGAIDNGGGPGTAVPEPATWALMITGFGGAGAMLRRRRRVVA
jgi:hypothetical protein